MSQLNVNTIKNRTGTSGPVLSGLSTVSGSLVVSSDATVSGAATVTGALTVGGVLTYEDVTNVDSVGIVTARTGLEVTANGLVINAGVSTFASDVSIADKIVHTGDTNTAIRFPAADTLTVETAGSERVRVGAAGSVGIGTDDPESALHVVGNIPNAPMNFGVHIGAHSGYGIMQFTAATGGIIDFGESGVDSVGRIIYTHSNDALAFQTGNSEALRIDSSGRLLVGTSSGSGEPIAGFQGRSNDASDSGIVAITRSGTNPSGSIGELRFATGSDFDKYYGMIICASDGSTTSTSLPGVLRFSTTASSATSPTERMRIDSSGRLLVGSTSARTNFNNGSASPQIQVENVTDGNSSSIALIHNENATGDSSAINFGKTRGGSVGDNSALNQAGDRLGAITFQGNDGTEFVQAASIEGFTDASPGANDMPGRLVFSTTADGAASPTERLRITSGGKIQVTGTRSGSLQASDDDALELYTASTDNSVDRGAGITFYNHDNSGYEMGGTIQVAKENGSVDNVASYMRFSTRPAGGSATEALRITSSGHVQIQPNASGENRLQFGGSGARLENTTAGGHIDLYTNSAVRNRFLYNGQGTEFSNQTKVIPTTDNSVDLGQGGNRYDDVFATNGTIQTSDSRLKQEVETSVLGIDFVKALRPVSYKWIEGKKVPIVDGTDENGDNIYRTDADGNWVYESRDGARRHWGFIAQEVKQVVDDANVDFAGWSLADKDDPDSTQSLRYEEFIAPLTKALQEAIAEIETLKTKVAALEG